MNLLSKSMLTILISLLLIPEILQAKAYKGAEVYVPDSKAVTYGRFEMRMMAAKGSGSLSTFFLYKNGSETGAFPWEEVDIEIKGKDNADNWQSNIITGTGGSVHSEQMHGPDQFADRFHTFTVEWTPGKVVWIVDGTVIRTTEGGQADSLTSPMGNRFNLWAASSEAWVGSFDPSILPIYQYVNWISYESYTPGAGPGGSDFTPEWRDDFDTFDGSRWAKANWTFTENLTDFDPANVVVKDGMLILCLTAEGATGFSGTVPVDNDQSVSTQKVLIQKISNQSQQLIIKQNRILVKTPENEYLLNGKTP